MARAYLEKYNGEWLEDFVYISNQPLKQRGFEIVPFDGESYMNDELDFAYEKYDIMIGSVESMKKFYKEYDISPKLIGYPDELSEYYHRNIVKKKARELSSDYPYFIKPVAIKLFTGDVIHSDSMKKLFMDYYDGVTPDTELYVSDVIDIISEYRCFIHEDKIVAIHYYGGDFWRYPNVSIIEDMVHAYKGSSPISYTIDVGVTDNDDTIIIELNDMWAIGSYGLDRDLYVKMCLDRINELKGLRRKH